MITHDLVRDGEVIASREFAQDDEVPKLAENKGAWLARQLVDPAFDPVTQVRSGPAVAILATKVKHTYAVRAKDAGEIAAMRLEVVNQIKAEAGRRILAIMPEVKQRNSLALGVELITTAGPDPAAWPAAMKATYAAVMGGWAQIKAIRLRSDELEATVPADPAGIAAFDPLAGWG